MNDLDLQQAMAEALAGEPAGGPDPITALHAGQRLRARRRWRTSIAVVVVVAVVVAISVTASLLTSAARNPRPAGPPRAVHGNGPIDVIGSGVFTVNVRTGFYTEIAGMYDAVEAISWSPDGTRLAYESSRTDTTPWRISVLTVRTGESRVLGSCSCYRGLAWSPDGTRIAVANGHRLQLWNPTPGPPTTIASFAGGVAYPTWSPDSRRLAFVVTNIDGSAPLYTINADGSRLTAIPNQPHSLWPVSLAWSPDGSTIAFLQLKYQKHPIASFASVMAINPNSGHPTRLAGAGKCVCVNLNPGLSWAPNGNRLALINARGSLYVMKPDGSGRRLLASRFSGGTPAWQPVP